MTTSIEEVWKTINGFPDYQVSNLGRIKSFKRNKIDGDLFSTYVNKHGYCETKLSKNNQRFTFKVHRLVAQAFLPNPDNLPQVNHKDENKLNNRIDNLEWCDAKYNINYGNHNLKSAKARGCPVAQIDIKTNQIIQTFFSAKEAERQTGINQGNISKCANHRSLKTTGGYKWCWVNQLEAEGYSIS